MRLSSFFQFRITSETVKLWKFGNNPWMRDQPVAVSRPTQDKPNVADEWLTFILRIRNVHGSNLGFGTGYFDWCFPWFSQFLQANAGIAPKIRPRPLPYVYFPNHHSYIILSFDAVQSELLKKHRYINYRTKMRRTARRFKAMGVLGKVWSCRPLSFLFKNKSTFWYQHKMY
jgi:hypothetical protein